jgi:hypothetical protein
MRSGLSPFELLEALTIFFVTTIKTKILVFALGTEMLIISMYLTGKQVTKPIWNGLVNRLGQLLVK